MGCAVPAQPVLCHAGTVLSSMRDASGGPNLRMRLLALVVALLLAGPLTVLLVRGGVRLLSLVF